MLIRNKHERLRNDGAMNNRVAPLQRRERQHVRRKAAGKIGRKILRERFSPERAKARADQARIDPQMLGAQKIRLGFGTRQKKENRAKSLVDLGNIFLGHKSKPPPNARMLE